MDASQLGFLPAMPIAVGPLAWVAVLLLAAVLTGEAARRWLRVPRLLGYLAIGMLLGPTQLNAIDATMAGQLRLFADIGVGLLLFEMGQRVDLGWLRRNPVLLVTSVAEALATFGAVFLVLHWAGVGAMPATAAAILAIATAPSVVMTVIKDLRAQGQVTERVLLLTVLNTSYAVIGLALWMGWMHLEARQPLATMILHPLYLLAGSALLAAVLSQATLFLLGLFASRPTFQFAVTLAMVLLAVSLAAGLQLSVPLALLALGLFTRVFDRERHFVALRFDDSSMLFVVLLFAVAGAGLDFRGWMEAAPLAAAFIGARFAAKLVPVLLLARASGISLRKAWRVGVGLTPLSALALLMLSDLTRQSAPFAAEIAAPLFLAVAVLSVLGPLALHFSLRAAGEAQEQEP